MKRLLIITILLTATACATAPYPPTDHIVYRFIDDGSKKMKECKFEGDKQETQCKQLVTLDYQTSLKESENSQNFAASDLSRLARDLRNENCKGQNIIHFRDTCGGKIEKQIERY